MARGLPVFNSPPLDTTILVVTPENVAFNYQLAGPFPRALALLVDLVLVCVFGLAMGIVFTLFGSGFLGVFLYLMFFIWWGYGGVMEALNNGQTLGKKALGLRVVSRSGLAINASQAMLRNILRGADVLPPFFPGVLAMLMNDRFQRLGDLASGTMVIVENRQTRPMPPFPNANTSTIQALIPKGFRPSVSLIEALAAYVGRRKELSPPRRRELAGLITGHFRSSWSLPRSIDADLLLCAMYEKATGSRPS